MQRSAAPQRAPRGVCAFAGSSVALRSIAGQHTSAPPNTARTQHARRGGGGGGGAFDVESLERENDRGIDALSERIGLLKQVRRR